MCFEIEKMIILILAKGICSCTYVHVLWDSNLLLLTLSFQYLFIKNTVAVMTVVLPGKWTCVCEQPSWPVLQSQVCNSGHSTTFGRWAHGSWKGGGGQRDTPRKNEAGWQCGPLPKTARYLHVFNTKICNLLRLESVTWLFITWPQIWFPTLYFKTWPLNQYPVRVRTLLSSSNSMTFHDLLHDLFLFSMIFSLNVTFENSQIYPCFIFKFAFFYVITGVRHNAFSSNCP